MYMSPKAFRANASTSLDAPGPDSYNRAMSLSTFSQNLGRAPAYRLIQLYMQLLCAYLAGMAVAWLVGYESIYGHPTPFYALYQPVFQSLLTPWSMLVLMLMAYWLISARFSQRPPWRQYAGLGLLGLLLILPILALYHFTPIQGHSVWTWLLAEWAALAWHLPGLVVFIVFLLAFFWANRRYHFLHKTPNKHALWGLLLGLVLTSFCFACAIAMIRHGFQGISQAFTRHSLEVVGDIGLASTIRGVFTRYVEMQPHLSLHGRVHPPGPVLLVWHFTYIVGHGALALSLITVAFGALAIIPLYFWVRELYGHRVALYSTLLYIFVPAVVLFGATSADTLFPPFTLTTLFLFERAIRRASIPYAIAAGLGYTAMGLMKYSLFGIGIYFAFAGLWLMRHPKRRIAVIQTAAVMFCSTIGAHLLIWYWSGFDLITSMQIAKEYVDHDRYHEQFLAPRAGFWTWRLLNPIAWVYFAGIPVSLLFFMRLRWRDTTRFQPVLWVLALTALVQTLLYLGAGEGERSALYVYPFLVVPAAHLLWDICRRHRLDTPLYATLAMLAFQCWLTESYFYTYW